MRLLSITESELNKLLTFELGDGHLIEAVHYRGDTLCISTQVGCHVRCAFCASGRNGLLRNLSYEEIVSQYALARSLLPVKRIAVAGIGEPLANWENVRRAFEFFRSEGLKVSFYTTGFPLGNLSQLLDLPHNGVSVSVHSLDPRIRKEIMPLGGNVEHLISFLKVKLPLLTRKKRKKVSLAYLLLKGVNDSREELVRLGQTALELGVGVTLLYYNKVGSFEPVSQQEYEDAFNLLRGMGVRVTLSTRFRKDKLGGCGTLMVRKHTDIYREEVKA